MKSEEEIRTQIKWLEREIRHLKHAKKYASKSEVSEEIRSLSYSISDLKWVLEDES